MNKAIILTIIYLILSCSAFAKPFDGWDKCDKTLFTSFTVFSTIDCLQTKYIFDNPAKYKENNFIINKFGKKGVVPYFVGTTIVSYFIADHLKPQYRKVFLVTINAIEINATRHNYRIGIKIRF